MAIAESIGLVLFLWIIGASALLIYFTRDVDFASHQTARGTPEVT